MVSAYALPPETTIKYNVLEFNTISDILISTNGDTELALSADNNCACILTKFDILSLNACKVLTAPSGSFNKTTPFKLLFKALRII